MMEFLRNQIGILQFTLSIPMMLILLWVFDKPAEAFQKSARRKAVWFVFLFYVFGVFLPWIKTEERGFFFCSLWNAWGLFYGVLLHKQLRKALGKGSRKSIVLFFAVFLLLWFQELFVAADNYVGSDQSFSIVPMHMVGFIGWYIGLGFLHVLGKRFVFISVKQAFVVGGIFGVLIEQSFLGVDLLHKALPLGQTIPDWTALWSFLSFAGFIFGVYGFYLAGPFLLFHEEYSERPKVHKPWKSILLFFLIWFAAIFFSWIWGMVLSLFS